MKLKEPYKRLFSVWGDIDRVHNALIMERMAGKTALDLGCGYGELADYLRQNGFEVAAVDQDEPSLAAGQKIFPLTNIRKGDARRLEFPDNFFDNVILKNVLHHLYAESDRDAIFKEILRVLAPGGNLVMFDPNPHIWLKICRNLVKHEDFECSPEIILEYLKSFNVEVREIAYYEILGIPLSGGFVGPQLFPNIKPLVRGLIAVNDGTSRLLIRLGLGKAFLWRYCLHAVKK